MKSAPEGIRGTFSLIVTADDLASKLDATLPAVMASRVLVGMMELAAMDAIRSYLEAGESSVGFAMDVNHIAATPVGHRVRAEAELTKAEGRRFEFKVRAWDETEEIGSGVHRRAVIDLAKFNQRLKPKMKG
ncbi:MAG: hotdog domain-containing protein [Candidatus Binataceae bacterium]